MNEELSINNIELSKELTLQQVWKDREWLENQVDFGNIHPNAITYLDKQIVLLEEIYPNQWDIYVSVERNNYKNKDYSKYRTESITIQEIQFYPIIHFENILIKNTLNQEIAIKSIYVMIRSRVDYEHNYKYFVQEIDGTRDIVSYNEYSHNYVHSHLKSHSYKGKAIDFTKFCLGDGEIGMMFVKLSQEFNDGFYKTLLFHLDGYLRWESLEGGPYVRIENLFLINKNDGIPHIPLNKVGEETKLILISKRTNQINLDWKIKDGKLIVIDNEKLEDFCLRYGQRKDSYSRLTINDRFIDIIYFKDNNGKYHALNSLAEQIVIPDESYIPFQRVKRYLRVTDTLSTENNKIYIHSQIKKNVRERLEYEANRNYIRNNIVDRLQNQGHSTTLV